MKVKSLSHIRLFATSWSVAHQAPPSMGFSRQEYWSGLPFPSPLDYLLTEQGVSPVVNTNCCTFEKLKLSYTRSLSKPLGLKRWLLQWVSSLIYLILINLGLWTLWIILLIRIIIISPMGCIFSKALNASPQPLTTKQMISVRLKEKRKFSELFSEKKENNELKDYEPEAMTCAKMS